MQHSGVPTTESVFFSTRLFFSFLKIYFVPESCVGVVECRENANVMRHVLDTVPGGQKILMKT